MKPDAPDSLSIRTGWRGLVLRGVAALALFILFFNDLLSPRRVLAVRDTFRLFFPAAQFWAEEVFRGRFPTWWPFDGIGGSFIGSGVTAPLSPFRLLGLVMAADQAVKWEVLLGYVVAAAGAARLSRALGADEAGQWFSAVCYGACGFLLCESDNLIFQQTPAFLPWTLLACLALVRNPSAARAGVLALCLSLAFWSGDVQGVLIQLALCALLIAVSNPVGAAGWFAAAMVLFAAWCAPLLPAVRAVSVEGGRGQFGYPLEVAEVWSLHPLRTLELLFGTAYPLSYYYLYPVEFGRGLGAPDWGMLFSSSVTVGTMALIGALTLAVSRKMSRGELVLGASGALALWLSFGKWGWLYGVFHRFVPVWSAFRYPQKLVVYTALSLAILGGVGLRELARPRRAVWIGLGLVALASVVVACLGQVPLVAAQFHLDVPGSHADVAETVALTVRLRGLTALLMVAVLAAAMARRPSWAPWTAALLGIAQVAWLSTDVIQPGDRSLVEHQPVLLAPIVAAGGLGSRICNGPDDIRDPALASAPPEHRWIHQDVEILTSDHGSRFGMGNILGYTPANSAALLDACSVAPPCGSACARRQGAQWGIVAASTARGPLPPGVTVEGWLDSPQVALLHDSLARPLVSAPGVRFASTYSELEHGVRTDVDGVPRAWVLRKGTEIPPEPQPVSFSRPRPNQIVATLDFTRPNLAVISEQASLGWHATLDGKPATIHRVDLAMMGVEAPAGRHQLVLQYVPPGWPWVWIPYALAWLGLAGIVVSARFRRAQGATSVE